MGWGKPLILEQRINCQALMGYVKSKNVYDNVCRKGERLKY